RSLELHLLNAHFEAPRGDRDLRVQLVHIGPDVRHQSRHGGIPQWDCWIAPVRPSKPTPAKKDQSRDGRSDQKSYERFAEDMQSPDPDGRLTHGTLRMERNL